MAQEIKAFSTWKGHGYGQVKVERVFETNILIIIEDLEINEEDVRNQPHLIDIEDFLEDFTIVYDENGMLPPLIDKDIGRPIEAFNMDGFTGLHFSEQGLDLVGPRFGQVGLHEVPGDFGILAVQAAGPK